MEAGSPRRRQRLAVSREPVCPAPPCLRKRQHSAPCNNVPWRCTHARAHVRSEYHSRHGHQVRTAAPGRAWYARAGLSEPTLGLFPGTADLEAEGAWRRSTVRLGVTCTNLSIPFPRPPAPSYRPPIGHWNLAFARVGRPRCHRLLPHECRDQGALARRARSSPPQPFCLPTKAVRNTFAERGGHWQEDRGMTYGGLRGKKVASRPSPRCLPTT